MNGTQALPLNWIRGDIEKGSYLGTTFYVHTELGKSSGFRYMNYNEMPAEVWNHQLMAVDVDSESSIEEYLIAEGIGEEHLTWHDVNNIGWTKPD